MSIHPSLRAAKGKSQRTVLKRTERIKDLMKKGKWSEKSDVFGLPKTKLLRLKVKKEKAAAKTESEATATATAKATPAADKEKKAK